MYQIAILTIMMFLSVSYTVLGEKSAALRFDALSGDVAATNFLSYRDAVIRYRNGNPAATGTIADGSLTWQTGFVRDARWTHEITSGKLYVYSTTAPPQSMVESLYKRTGATILVGVKQSSGSLAGPGGVLSTTLPGTIPSGAIVYMGG